jgi:hypothetical protein
MISPMFLPINRCDGDGRANRLWRNQGESLRLTVGSQTLQSGRQLGAGADPQLAVDAGQVGLDRAQGDEQVVGHFLVVAAGGDQFGDLGLGLGEGQGGRWSSADAGQLLSGLVHP